MSAAMLCRSVALVSSPLVKRLVPSSVATRSGFFTPAFSFFSFSPNTLVAASSSRSFASNNINNDNNTKKKKKPRRLSSKQRRKRESEKQKRRNEYKARQQKLKRQKNLHPAAKMKRILSATDYWFSRANLVGDAHLQEQLALYNGHVPLTNLLTFPKFEHWVDLQLLYDAYTSQAAKKRYAVVVSKDLYNHGIQEAKRQRKQVREAEKRERQLEKQQRKQAKKRRKRLNKLKDARFQFVFDLVRQQIFEETRDCEEIKEWLKEERLQQKEEQKKSLLQESSLRGYLERNRTWTAPLLNIVEQVEDYVASPREEDMLTIEDIDSCQVHDVIEYGGEFDAFLNPDHHGFDFAEYRDEDDEDPFTEATALANEHVTPEIAVDNAEDGSGIEPGNVVESVAASNALDFDPLMNPQDDALAVSPTDANNNEGIVDGNPGSHESASSSTDFDPLMNDDDKVASTQNDDPTSTPSADTDTVADKDFNLEYAFLRHKRVSLEYLDELNSRVVVDESEHMDDWYGFDDTFNNAGFQDSLEEPTATKPKKKKQLPNYSTRREIVVIQNSTALKSFCEKLMQSVKQNAAKHDPNYYSAAIGFDVEYCSLELDIRNTLPAMLQLAGPGDDAPVGLVWLDKFPNHGRNMLGKEEYEPLLKILADSTLLKVGVGASKDVKHLANWWGINDVKYQDYFFGGIVDLEYYYQEGTTMDKSLAELCESVLGRRLPKFKEKLSKKQKKRKRAGRKTPTAHWRKDELTMHMKKYAANDASCGIDVWTELQKQKDETMMDGDEQQASSAVE